MTTHTHAHIHADRTIDIPSHTPAVEGILIIGLTELTYNCNKYMHTIVILMFVDDHATQTDLQNNLFGYKSCIPDDLKSKLTFLVVNMCEPDNKDVAECFKVSKTPTFVINKTRYNTDTTSHEFRRMTNIETTDVHELICHIRKQID